MIYWGKEKEMEKAEVCPSISPIFTGLSIPRVEFSRRSGRSFNIFFLIRRMIVEPPYSKKPFSFPRTAIPSPSKFVILPTSIAPTSICTSFPKTGLSIVVYSRQFCTNTGIACSAMGRTVWRTPGIKTFALFLPLSA